MKVEELIEKLKTMEGELPIVLCDLNNDRDVDGGVPMPEIYSVEFIPADTEVGPSQDCVFINFEGH